MSVLDYILGMIYPNRCEVCGILTEYSQVFCLECSKKIDVLKINKLNCDCQRCYQQSSSCICNNIQSIENIYTIYYYQDEVKDIMLLLKKHKLENIFKFFAKNLADSFNLEKTIDVITYVPAKQSKHTFNQSEVLAREISKILKIPIIQPPIVRLETSLRQHELSAKDRKENANNSYQISNAISLKDNNIILVDDIITTGFTIQRCAQILKELGASSVCCASIVVNR